MRLHKTTKQLAERSDGLHRYPFRHRYLKVRSMVASLVLGKVCSVKDAFDHLRGLEIDPSVVEAVRLDPGAREEPVFEHLDGTIRADVIGAASG